MVEQDRSIAIRRWDVVVGEQFLDRVCASQELLEEFLHTNTVYRLRGRDIHNALSEYIGQATNTARRLNEHKGAFALAAAGNQQLRWYTQMPAASIFSIEIITRVSLLANKNVTP
jgi:hypothetical protein